MYVPTPPEVVKAMLETAGVRLPEANCSVRLPGVPLIERPLKVATPDVLVVAVVVPPRVPPPLAMVALTTTPLWLTGLSDASRS